MFQTLSRFWLPILCFSIFILFVLAEDHKNGRPVKDQSRHPAYEVNK